MFGTAIHQKLHSPVRSSVQPLSEYSLDIPYTWPLYLAVINHAHSKTFLAKIVS